MREEKRAEERRKRKATRKKRKDVAERLLLKSDLKDRQGFQQGYWKWSAIRTKEVCLQ